MTGRIQAIILYVDNVLIDWARKKKRYYNMERKKGESSKKCEICKGYIRTKDLDTNKFLCGFCYKYLRKITEEEDK